jgi:hypothetical protein
VCIYIHRCHRIHFCTWFFTRERTRVAIGAKHRSSSADVGGADDEAGSLLRPVCLSLCEEAERTWVHQSSHRAASPLPPPGGGHSKRPSVLRGQEVSEFLQNLNNIVKTSSYSRVMFCRFANDERQRYSRHLVRSSNYTASRELIYIVASPPLMRPKIHGAC